MLNRATPPEHGHAIIIVPKSFPPLTEFATTIGLFGLVLPSSVVLIRANSENYVSGGDAHSRREGYSCSIFPGQEIWEKRRCRSGDFFGSILDGRSRITCFFGGGVWLRVTFSNHTRLLPKSGIRELRPVRKSR